MEKEQKQTLFRILLSLVLLIVAWLLPLTGWPKLLCFLVPYLIAGYETLLEAAEGIVHGEVFDEDFLMSIATIGALVLGEYPEAVAVMLFFQVGELFEDIAEEHSRRSITDLMDIRPDSVCVERNGALSEVHPEEVAVGEIIVVKPGEKIPLDGEIAEGAGTLDTAALTGESLPRTVQIGDAVLSGCVSLSGLLRIRVSRPFGESTVARILTLVEQSTERKSRSEGFITRFAARYTPAVCIAAVLLAVATPLIAGGWTVWIHRALIFLVVSCPCALVISVPLTFFAGIGGASKRGILIKGSNYMDALCAAEIAVFDKTGTLTEGRFAVKSTHPSNCTEETLLETAALAESFSDHPVARSLKSAWGGAADSSRVKSAEELAGRGVKAVVDGKEVLAGNAKLMAENDIACAAATERGTVIHTAADGIYLGCIVVADVPKPDAAETVRALRERGIRIVMLTGDRTSAAEAVAAELGIGEVYSELLPGDKVEKVEALLREKSPKGKLLFVGDGINDAPVLSRADVGIAMGALGSDAAIEASDVVLMDDQPAKLLSALDAAKRTKRIVTENIVFALVVKFLVLALTALGAASMWAASFADVGVCVLAVLNAMRALKQ